MKTLKIVSTALIVAFSLSAFANEKKANRKMKKTETVTGMVISAPAMEWGDVSDVDYESLKKLKTSPYLLFEAPAMTWGDSQELDIESIEKLRNAPLIAAPEMVWGNPMDVHYFEVSK